MPAVPETPRVRTRLIWAGAAVVTLIVAVALLRQVTRAPEPDARATLEARATALGIQLDLARAEARYLVLDPEQGALSFYHGGALLRSWPVTEVELGARRWIATPEWAGQAWTAARMDPPVERPFRVILSDSVAPPDLAGAETFIPPTPDEAVPTPPRFTVHYTGRLGLEVVAVESSDSTVVRTGWTEDLGHTFRRLLPRNWDRYRVRVRMAEGEAGALYRSLPDSTALVIIAPGK